MTGLYEERINDNSNRVTRGVWWTDEGDNPRERFISNGDNRFDSLVAKSQIYLGPDASGSANPDDVRLSGYIEVRLPQIGDTYGIWYFDNRNTVEDGVQNQWSIIEALIDANLSKQNLRSEAASLQSRFLSNNFVAPYSFRKDKLDSWRNLQSDAFYGPTGSQALYISDPGITKTNGNFNEALLFLEDDPFRTNEGKTSSFSAVAHLPEEWA